MTLVDKRSAAYRLLYADGCSRKTTLSLRHPAPLARAAGERDQAGTHALQGLLPDARDDVSGGSVSLGGLARLPPSHPAFARSRSAYFWILPVLVFGSSVNST
jgi:hypothetical protein